MSNQNFDTNSPFPSSSQPLPIAQQLGSQSYLSQVQDKRDVLADDGQTQGTSDATQQYSNPSPPITEAQQRENKMDAFFRQAEEEREREQAGVEVESESEAEAVVSNQDFQSSDIPPSQQSPVITENPEAFAESNDSQQLETPVVEIPEMTDPVADSAQEVVQPLSGDEATFQTFASVDTASQNEIPFSLNSFGTSFHNSASEQPLQSTPQQPQVETPVQIELSASTNEQPILSSDPLPNANPSNENNIGNEDQNKVAPPPQNTLQSEGNTRKLTGAAALSAGMAAAGLGAFAERLVGGKVGDAGEVSDEQAGSDVSEMNDPSDLLRQQMADEEQGIQSRSSLATYDMSSNDSSFESPEEDKAQLDKAQLDNARADDVQVKNVQVDHSQAENVQVDNVQVDNVQVDNVSIR